MNRQLVASLALAAATLGATGAAHAGSHVSWSIGINVPGPAPVYVQPAPVYVEPAPVVYAPPPRVVYVRPQPVMYAPAPVYVRPAPVYVEYGRGWHHHHRHGW